MERNLSYYYHLGEYLPFEPIFVKSGTTSLRFARQKSALESCHLYLELEDEDNPPFYPYNPCRHGYVLLVLKVQVWIFFDWFSCLVFEPVLIIIDNHRIDLVRKCNDGEIIFEEPSGTFWLWHYDTRYTWHACTIV